MNEQIFTKDSQSNDFNDYIGKISLSPDYVNPPVSNKRYFKYRAEIHHNGCVVYETYGERIGSLKRDLKKHVDTLRKSTSVIEEFKL